MVTDSVVEGVILMWWCGQRGGGSDPGVVVTDSVVEGVILEPREIARRYVTSWFALDLVSSLPVDYVIVLVSPDTAGTHLVHAGQHRLHAQRLCRSYIYDSTSIRRPFDCLSSLRSQ